MATWTKSAIALLGTMSDKDIAERRGSTRQAVWRKRQALGIARGAPRGHWPKGTPRSDLTAAQAIKIVAMVRRAQRSGMSLRDIERKTGVSVRQLSRWLRREVRPIPESAKLIRLHLRRYAVNQEASRK